MLRVMKNMCRKWRDESGAATVEFVIVFPFFVGLFLSAFDVAMMNLRAVMLERGLDLVVRDIRLSSGAPLVYSDIIDDVCDSAGMIPDCRNNLRVELTPINTTSWNGLQNRPACIARNSSAQPAVVFKNGAQNELMLFRVCATVDTVFPGIGVGRTMPRSPGGGYNIISSTVFVNEPT